MALSPLEPVDIIEEVEAQPEPSKTYRLDLESGEIGGLVDGDEALRQFIAKAIRTARFRFLIYDDDYGSELEDLIGEDVTPELLESEIPRVITEALIYDDRVAEVADFRIVRDGDKVTVSFTVIQTNGEEISEEVAI
jgi:phage baseplate assembly protein W